MTLHNTVGLTICRACWFSLTATQSKSADITTARGVWDIYGLQMAAITLLWLVGRTIDSDGLVSNCILGSCDRLEFPPFLRHQWQFLCTALTAGKLRAVQRDCERVYGLGQYHNDVITWKHFPQCWPILGLTSHTKPVLHSFVVFFVVSTNKLLNKQTSFPWFWGQDVISL